MRCKIYFRNNYRKFLEIVIKIYEIDYIYIIKEIYFIKYYKSFTLIVFCVDVVNLGFNVNIYIFQEQKIFYILVALIRHIIDKI